MNILSEIRARFRPALESLQVDDTATYLEMIKPSQDPQFGDYQANCAMPLANQLGESPRKIADRLIAKIDVADLCQNVEVAGPGFINLTLCDQWLSDQLDAALHDERLGIPAVDLPRTYIIDYSAPNVAKPMHVGHIRSTVIGDSLAHTLRFLGHQVITDNHVGDWGTQFGMIIYGYKHFLDPVAFARDPVMELARLYRMTNRLVQYWRDLENAPQLEQKLADLKESLRTHHKTAGDSSSKKKRRKELKRLEGQIQSMDDELRAVRQQIVTTQEDSELGPLAVQHPDIEQSILEETALLHSGEENNLSLWRQFMPVCMAEIDRIYHRLGITFDHTLGESFYQDRLAATVVELQNKGLACESDGAICIFSDNHDIPMIIRKKDGAFLYATTDLATINYRLATWSPQVILYVVDHRQSLHFEQLFDASARSGHDHVELIHVKFGTVLGEDGRPFKTRSGSTVDLDGLLDEAIRRAREVVEENNPSLNKSQGESIAETIGIAALKYADLSQNRESDYVFSYDKMLALNGNTATYMQYAYARIQSILHKGKANIEHLLSAKVPLRLEHPAERAMSLAILRFAEAVELVAADYRPNHLTNYLFEQLAKSFSNFFEQCPVLKADTDSIRDERFLLCDLTARTLKMGLALLGIDVVEKM